VIREPLAEPPIVPLTKGLYWEDGNLKYDGLETIFGFQNQGTSTTFGKSFSDSLGAVGWLSSSRNI